MSKNKCIFLSILVSTLTVGMTAVIARYLLAISATRKQLNSWGSQVIETDCGPIEYTRIGEGYPVLVVHGTMGGFDQGLMVAKPIIDAGYQAIAISRFGYLRSPLPEDASLNRQADLYASLFDALDIQQAAVFTFSAGATSSIRFAARHPERVSALVLLAPAAPGKVSLSPPPRAIFDTLMRSDFLFWAMITYNRPFGYQMLGVPKGFPLTSAYKAKLDESLATTLPVSRRINGFLFDNFNPQFGKDFSESIAETNPYPLGEIKTPVLVIDAKDDPYANIENVRGLAEKFPNARMFVVPGGGHPHLGHGQEIDAEIMQFLNSIVAVNNRPR